MAFIGQLKTMRKFTGVALTVVLVGICLFVWSRLEIGQQPLPSGSPGVTELEEPSVITDVTLPDQLSENAQIGKRAFEVKCAVCHGQSAAGKNGVAPPLVHSIYRPGHHADAAFLIAARNGVRAHHWKFGSMPPVEDITEGEVRLVTQYIRELQRANGIE
ncbi:c-type cytochrome [Tritonibacter mobilis]|uniref:c-type cytochrome n=1 Tax=Tritonibacter mobilis TaxID=379347 RepID=UPI0008963568|nr:cytochrome c [Tritonibacter mobilis]SDX85468.1 Cytochrome c [Tritonibacter mobilis]